VALLAAFFLLGCAKRDLDGDMQPAVATQRFDGTMPVPGAVAADHVLASEAGASVLRAGGNAVDAAIAAALASGVVQPSGSGLGGGGFALVVPAEGEPNVLDFREVAPAAASIDAYATAGASTRGGLAVAVPSEGIGLAELHRMYGRATLATIAGPAIRLAEEGFPTGEHLARSLEESPDMRALFLAGNRRPGLAEALRAWVDSGGEAFRGGWVAEDMVHAARAQGGLVTLDDIKNYKVKLRKPLLGRYAGRTVLTMPPPSSGGIALLQVLGSAGPGASLHCEVEATKHAMADRAAFGGDPDFAAIDVPGLLDPRYLATIAADCGPQTFPPEHYAPSPPPADDHGTLHISAIDAEGVAVALTTTINTSFGSHVIAGRSGIVLNNQMDDFATRFGVPNAFGLVQGAQNAVAPGKRPLSSMTPTIVLGADGEPEIAVGASGGPFIITATTAVLRAILDDGAAASDAVSRSRWHHQWMPNAAIVEADFAAGDTLRAAGHDVRTIEKPFSSVQVVVSRRGDFDAASDPRKGGAPAFSR